MHLLRDLELPDPGLGACVALGMFDGVHLGHQHVVRQALLNARALGVPGIVVTFHPHPLAVVRPDQAPRLLQSLNQRLRALKALGAQDAVPIPFTRETAQLDGADFIRLLARDVGRLRSIAVGEGFQFGRRRTGDVALLHTLGKELGFTTVEAAPIKVGKQRVSSTRIREALRTGDLSTVAELLGRPYAIEGTVQQGQQLGRRIGFPTANILLDGLELPPLGVYAARARCSRGCFPAVLNIGVRPTVSDAQPLPRLEVHLLDFTGDLYGCGLEVEFVRHLRPERRFPNIDALTQQITVDVAAARAALA